MARSCTKFNHVHFARFFRSAPTYIKEEHPQQLAIPCPRTRHWHEACESCPGSAIPGEAATNSGSSAQRSKPMESGRISRRHLMQGGAALTLGAAAGLRPAFAA